MYTILDIARKAGVSHSTVSRILNKKFIRCKQQTRDKILRIAAELNYYPNISARNLKTRAYHAIGFLAYDITDMFAVDCIRAIEETLAPTDYRALWISAKLHRTENQSDLLKELHGLPIDGLIVIESDNLIADVELLRIHARDRMRISTLIRKIHGGHICSVTLDDALGIKLLVDHLVGLGHRELAFLPDVQMHPGPMVRFKTFKNLLREYNLPIREEWWQPTDATVEKSNAVEEGFAATKRLLNNKFRPTAIIAFNDLAAFGCIRACKEQGIPVPEKISVAGFDDISMAAHYNPSLTTISSNYPVLAKSAVAQMLSMIEHRRELFEADHVVVKPELVVRESTAAPPSSLILGAGAGRSVAS